MAGEKFLDPHMEDGRRYRPHNLAFAASPIVNNSPYRRPRSNPSPSMTETFTDGPVFQNQNLYRRRESFDGVKPFAGKITFRKENEQAFLYHNPLHYGSSSNEDLSPEGQDGYTDEYLYPRTPLSTRHLGSSGESGYHGGIHDANPSSSISSTSTKSPRTPSRFAISGLSNRSSNYPPTGRGSSSGVDTDFASPDYLMENVPHGTYGLPVFRYVEKCYLLLCQKIVFNLNVLSCTAMVEKLHPDFKTLP
jgi:hypothetical protein